MLTLYVKLKWGEITLMLSGYFHENKLTWIILFSYVDRDQSKDNVDDLYWHIPMLYPNCAMDCMEVNSILGYNVISKGDFIYTSHPRVNLWKMPSLQIHEAWEQRAQTVLVSKAIVPLYVGVEHRNMWFIFKLRVSENYKIKFFR